MIKSMRGRRSAKYIPPIGATMKRCGIPPKASPFKAPTKFETKTGRWERWERSIFLRGLQKHGRGQWSSISRLIPTRTTIQVKSHAQVVLRRMDDGHDIFAELENDDSTVETMTTSSKEWRCAPARILALTPDHRDLEVAKVLTDVLPRDGLGVDDASPHETVEKNGDF